MTDSAPNEVPGLLQDGDLQVDFIALAPHPVHRVPTYQFRMVNAYTKEEFGAINLRVGSTPHIEKYAGHSGYSVLPAHRGHRYASRSLRLLLPLARKLKQNPIWITCDPDNLPLRRTCELAGAIFVEIVDVPETCVIYRSGHIRKCRYRLDVDLPD